MDENSNKPPRKRLDAPSPEEGKRDEKNAGMRSGVFESELEGTLDSFFDELEDGPPPSKTPVIPTVQEDQQPPVSPEGTTRAAPAIKKPGKKKPVKSPVPAPKPIEDKSPPKVSKSPSSKPKEKIMPAPGAVQVPEKSPVTSGIEKKIGKSEPAKPVGKGFPKLPFIILGVLLIAGTASLLYQSHVSVDQPGPPAAPPQPAVYAVADKPLAPTPVEVAVPPAPAPKATEAETIFKEETSPVPPYPAILSEENQPATAPMQKQAEETPPASMSSGDQTRETQPAPSFSSLETEDAQPTPESLKAQATETPSPAPVDDTSDIRAFLTRWNAAWESFSNDDPPVETVLPYYSDAFASGGLDKTAWVKERAGQYRQKKWSPLEIQGIRVLKPSEKDTLRYVVHFHSTQGNTDLHQTLILSKEPDGWKILATHYPPRSYPYTVHVGSFKSVDAAGKLADAHRKSGLQSFWVRADLGAKGVWYRVFIGCYETLAAAEKIVAEEG